MAKYSYYAAMAVALVIGAAAIDPAVSQTRPCSNAPKSYTPCPHPHTPAQPLVPNAD